MQAANFIKRILVIGVIVGLGCLALFIASEMDNIIVTSDKEILLLMPGVPIVVAVILLNILNWKRYFAFSEKLFILTCVCLVGLAFAEGVSLQNFYNMMNRLNPGFSDGYYGEAGRYALILKTKSALATLTGAMYIASGIALVWFIAYGAFGSRREPADGAAVPDETPQQSRGYLKAFMIGGGIGVAVLVLVSMWTYYSVPPEVLDAALVEAPVRQTEGAAVDPVPLVEAPDTAPSE